MGRKGSCSQADSQKKRFPETDFTAMKMARTPHSSIGKPSAFLGPYACTKQEHRFAKLLLHWKHLPPAVLALSVDARGQSSILCLPALLLGLSVPEETWPAATAFLQQPEDRTGLLSVKLSVSKYGHFLGLAFSVGHLSQAA